MKRSLFALCLLSIFFSCKPKHNLPIIKNIDTGWTFRSANTSNWYTATVPGNVYTDLLQHKLIEDPFIKNNEEKVQWVSDSSWVYQTVFSVDHNTLQKKNIQLHFDGLDTYSKVYLNDQLILSSNNAFRQYTTPIKSIVKQENTIRVEFESTAVTEHKEKGKLAYKLPEGNRVFTRKAQFQYGWDWGPKLNTSGIWKSVYLKAWDDYKIKDVYIHQKVLNDSIASLLVEVKKNSTIEIDKKLTYEIYINGSLIKSSNAIHKGGTWYEKINIKNPKLWWPHNLGIPYLYDFKIVVREGELILDTYSLKKGLRTIKLVTEKDSIGASFYFKVNGTPVYMKGANYIPQNSFQNKVSDSHYKNLLHNVVEVNMNMLRVWGGGIYENDIFYKLCDEKGILVWQDFMFACAMYPGDEDYLNNIYQEAIDQIKRLRNYASIALWCGNNENSEGWHRWGWQSDRSETEKTEIWNNYLKVFDNILPNTVAKLSQTPYWESSPKYGRGNPKYKIEGDAHDWWVWHDGYPFEHFEENVPRFMSEFGFQSFPSYQTINYINQDSIISIDTDAIRSHQKHSRGFKLIDTYMKRDYPSPKNDEDYIYMSQLTQAKGITMGIEAHRRAKPYNMGSIYWQLNDCWPAISWSSIDYFGHWKALHYKAKRSFENVLISSKIKDNKIQIHLVSDLPFYFKDTLHLKVIDFDGKELWKYQKEIHVQENSSQLAAEFPIDELSKNLKCAVLISTTNNTETSYHYFSKPKELLLSKSKIDYSIKKSEDGFLITLSSGSLQKDVFLFTETKGHFSDNFFDIPPKEKVAIFFRTDASSLNQLKIKSLNQFIP